VNYGFLHDSDEDWCDRDGPEVGMLLGWKRHGCRYDDSLLPLHAVELLMWQAKD